MAGEFLIIFYKQDAKMYLGQNFGKLQYFSLKTMIRVMVAEEFWSCHYGMCISQVLCEYQMAKKG